ncbi:ankyrin repeat-containing domain protein [Coprinopsis sp. MPI-PUGE-AT-0042]|nr:ankyrin repeat-containing domain protein [Coprinopsis sp. MPI-PUGE-AT-0042]
MRGAPKRKGSSSQPLDIATKRKSWEDNLAPPLSESSPTASGSVLISGAHTVHVNGGTFNVAGPGSTNTTNNHHSGPQILPVDVLEILNSLSLPNFRDIQLDTLSKATKGTCIWLTEDDMFLVWISNGKILWGIGIPGAGKTILASIVINYLDHLEKTSGGAICLTYVYLRYSEPLSVRDVLESFVKQIVERHADLGDLVEGLYTVHKRERTKPSQEELQNLLSEFTKQGKTIFFVLDALDEMRAECRPHLLRFLASLNARLFITSRPLDTLQQQFPQAQVFNIAARPSDLDLHVKDFLRHSPDVVALSEGTGLEERIVETIHRKSGGMFLHAKLQLEALHNCVSALDVEETLDAFPTDIEDVYTKTWQRIIYQGPKQSNLAKLVLLWITHAHGEMTIDALRRAIATSPETHVFDPKRMVPKALLISVCCGLVSVDDKTRIVRLIHYTTRDAILPRILELFPIPHALLAHVCIAHIATCGLQNYSETAIGYGARNQREEDLKNLMHSDSLLAYAHRSWAHHTSQCDQYPPVIAVATALVLNSMAFPLDGEDRFDLVLQSPNAQTQHYKDSLLMLAVEHGHLTCAKALLSLADVDVNLRGCDGRSALMCAIEKEHMECLQLLLKSPAIDLNVVGHGGLTALLLAFHGGYLEAVKLLLESPGIDINAVDTSGWTALMFAALGDCTEVVKLLLGLPGIDINAVDENSWTALMHATRWGYTEVVKVLLGFPGIDINAEDKGGCTALILAAEKGKLEVVKHLLDAPSVDINQVCCIGGWGRIETDYKNEWTALMVAAHEGHTDVVKQLLNAPRIDANVVCKTSRETALSHASKRGHKEIVDLLLAFPGTIV